MLTSLLTTKLAAAAAAAAVAAFGGGIAAAYTGVLPAVLQKIAHSAIAAPGMSPSRSASAKASHPVGPDVTGSAAYGLCTAYQHANASQRAVAFRKLVSAVGGEGKVTAYCRSVAPSPGQGHGRSGPSAAQHGHRGKPTAVPSAVPSHGKRR